MARGTSLLNLLRQLRAELEISVNPAHNVQARDIQVDHLQRVQTQLWDDYNWPHLRVFRYLNAQAGQRMYDPAAVLKENSSGNLVAAGDLSIDRVTEVWVRDGTIWRKLDPGISEEHYNSSSGLNDERDWPPRRWQVNEGNEIEIWPSPAITGSTTTKENILRLRGIKNLSPLTDDTHTADLDDRLITLMAAADMLGGEKGQKKGRLATRRLLQVRGNSTKIKRFNLFGSAEEGRRVLRGPPTVYYRTT